MYSNNLPPPGQDSGNSVSTNTVHAGGGIPAKRKSISKKTRFEVFKRDGFRCLYCGLGPPSVNLEVDHIIPVKLGGYSEVANYATSCEDCNAGKKARPLDQLPAGHEKTLKECAEKLERLRSIAGVITDTLDAEDELIYDLSCKWAEKMGWDPEEDGFDDREWSSVRKFLKHLTPLDIVDSMNIAVDKVGSRHPKTQFKYFCGVCWKKIKTPTELEQTDSIPQNMNANTNGD